MITADDVHAHWPELIMGAYKSVVICTCGGRFEDGPIGPAAERWSAHLADEVNAWLKLLAGGG